MNRKAETRKIVEMICDDYKEAESKIGKLLSDQENIGIRANIFDMFDAIMPTNENLRPIIIEMIGEKLPISVVLQQIYLAKSENTDLNDLTDIRPLVELSFTRYLIYFDACAVSNKTLEILKIQISEMILSLQKAAEQESDENTEVSLNLEAEERELKCHLHILGERKIINPRMLCTQILCLWKYISCKDEIMRTVYCLLYELETIFLLNSDETESTAVERWNLIAKIKDIETPAKNKA